MKKMLNRKEYNATFKTSLTKEQFKEIMGNPVSDISDIEELVLADKKGNAWYFLPKEKAIPKKWIQEYIWGADTHDEKRALRKMYIQWEKENE